MAVDIVFYVLIGLAFIGGLFGGLKRAFKGFYIGVITVIFAIFLTGATIAPVRELDVCEDLTASLTESTSEWGEVYNMPIYIVRNEDGSPVLDKDGRIADFYVIVGDSTEVKLSDAASAGLASKAKAKTALRLATRFVNESNDGTSLAGIAADALASVIIEVVLFVIYGVGISLILVLLRIFVFGRMHDSDSVIIQVVDRVLGAVIAAALAMLVLLIILAIIRAVVGTGSATGNYFATAKGTGYLYLNNPTYQLLNKIFG